MSAVGITQSGGAITQAAGAGEASFSGAAAAIDLSNANNDFTGSVSLVTSGPNNATVTDSNDLNIGDSMVGGSLAASAANNLTQSGDVTTAGDLTLTAGSSLTMVAGTSSSSGGSNISCVAITGTVTQAGAISSQGGSISVDGENGITLAASGSSDSGGGEIVYTSRSGVIVQDGNIATQGGASTVEGSTINMAATARTDTLGGDITYMTTGSGDLVIGILNAGDAAADQNALLQAPPEGTRGVVTLTSQGGSILDADANNDIVNIRGGSTTLTAAGTIGAINNPVTIVVPLIEGGPAEITLISGGGAINNPNFAEVDQRLAPQIQTPVEAAVGVAVGSSVLSALEEIGFVDWAGLDPDVRLVDCLEPCIKLPADQVEDEGMAALREPTRLLLIRSATGTKVVPIFAQPIAKIAPAVSGSKYESVMD